MVADPRIDECDKSLPPGTVGQTRQEAVASGLRLSDFSTPLLTLDRTAIEHNLATMAAWCSAHHLAIAPHGKTTMAPDLWQLQLDAGAWGITIANVAQLRVALAVGVRCIQLANALVDPNGLRLLQAHLAAHPDVTVLTWVDNVATVEAMERVLDPGAPPVQVLVELGAPGGRTGARSVDDAIEVATAVRRSEVLALAGVSGYEGALAHDTSPDAQERVSAYLRDMAALHARLRNAGLYEVDQPVVTAGGSAYFDLVARELAPLADEPGTLVMVRSGAYLIHDDGFYRTISPLSRGAGTPLVPAMHLWARVLSRPEPGLALLDAGRRDVPFDEGLPEPQLAASDLGQPARPLTGTITAVNDQHAFLSLAADDPLAVGDVVRLGLSHPCTAFDKWRVIPVFEDADQADPALVDLVRTYF